MAFGVLAIIVVIALVPAYCRSRVEPDQRYPTAAAARASADAGEWVPAFLPATATDIYERHGEGRRFVRFTADSAALVAMTGGMRRVESGQVGKIPLPTPGWSTWWPISPRTLQGGQGKQIHVFQVEDPRDHGYLAIDPRSQRAFYWAVPRE